MATLPDERAVLTPHRVVLVDFDWQDADLIPELFRRPDVSVRLVAGEGTADPGLRVAEMCGLPRTLDLADLTREIFDLALVGERSSRRTQLESLLLALGTPSQTPQDYLKGSGPSARPGVEASLTLHAAAFEQSLSGDADAAVEAAIPDLTEETPLQPRALVVPSHPRILIPSLEDFPSVESRRSLEEALKGLVLHSGAGTAELHAGEGEQLRLVAQVGPEDRLLKGLVDLANEMGTPQVVTRLSDPGRGRTWGAWPFRSMQRRGVLAAAAIDASQGWSSWQKMVDDLKGTWDQEDRQRASASFPFTPLRAAGWLDVEEFRSRLELSLERHRHDRMRFELHRLEFPDAAAAIEMLVEWMPGQIRDSDCITRPGARVVMLLTAGPSESFLHLRRRLLALWDTAWRDSGFAPPASAIVDQHVALVGPEDAEAFLAAAGVWLSQH